ncbi:MAG: hypothetical protein K2M31_06120, partial [Muribaculaceae bacterium]|nr:hypothetical protein [Muribaculaceae bacterium]
GPKFLKTLDTYRILYLHVFLDHIAKLILICQFSKIPDTATPDYSTDYSIFTTLRRMVAD